MKALLILLGVGTVSYLLYREYGAKIKTEVEDWELHNIPRTIAMPTAAQLNPNNFQPTPLQQAVPSMVPQSQNPYSKYVTTQG